MKKIRLALLIALGLVTSAGFAQENRSQLTNQAVVTTFLAGFNDFDRVGESLALLDDDYHFTDPTATANSKAEFIELAKTLAQVLTGVEVVKIAESGDWVSVNYIFKSAIPGLEENQANEWFRVENGKIQESHLLFDATEWHKVFAEAGH